MTIHCPADTRDIVTVDGNCVNQNQISNFALRYRYFLERRIDNSGKITFGLQAQQHDQETIQVPSLGGSQEALAHLRNRQMDQLRCLASNGNLYSATSRIDWRMVVGLGSDHVQETNMTLDHIYGIPYFPGSAFKGVLRSWVIQERFQNNEISAMQDTNFVAVFGSQKSAGQVQFLDALPHSGVYFDIDIMNPHFSDYYTRTAFPTDDQRLIQIYFLVLKNTHFRFLMVAKATDPLQLAKDWFTKASADRGFGAKSSIGYGYFRELNDKSEELKYEIAEKLSLDDAYDIYINDPSQLKSVYIDIEMFHAYAPILGVIVTEEICEVDSIEGISEIPDTLIEKDADMVIPSEFGKSVWEKTKDRLFERVLPAFPNLVYRSQFRRARENLSPADCKLLQEKLLQVAIDVRRNLNRNLSEADRELLGDKLLQVAEDLGNGDIFAGLTQDKRTMLADKLWDIAEDLASEAVVPDTIDVEGGRTIECRGIDDGKLVLQTYTNP